MIANIYITFTSNNFLDYFCIVHLAELHLVNFKNYDELNVQFSSGINCFVGKNGSGKTNILDAVYYLSMTKSYLNVIDKQNVKFDQPFFSILGSWEKSGNQTSIHCVVKLGSKKVIKKNKKEYTKITEHIGQFPVVMISPYDRDLISEGSELRRKWIDGIISQFDASYLDELIKYQKVLDQRNALLKNMHENRLFDRESIDIWNAQLIPLGERIHLKRQQFIAEFSVYFQEKYFWLTQVEEPVSLVYKSQLNDQSFKDLLLLNERKDAFSHYTNGGIHKDDFLFLIKEHPIKKFGSQGQQKSFLIALKLAQYAWLENHLKLKPVLLLDDIFDKLDENRVKHLMDLVSSETFGQVLITDTEQSRLNQIFSALSKSFALYEVQQNQVTKLQ